MFSCEICKIFKNTFFTEHLRTTTSVIHASTFRIGLSMQENVLLNLSFHFHQNHEIYSYRHNRQQVFKKCFTATYFQWFHFQHMVNKVWVGVWNCTERIWKLQARVSISLNWWYQWLLVLLLTMFCASKRNQCSKAETRSWSMKISG